MNPFQQRFVLPLLSLITLIGLVGACGTSSEAFPPPGPDAGIVVPDAPPPPPPPDAAVAVPDFQAVEGWSVRRRELSTTAQDFLLEEKVASFADDAPGASRVRIPAAAGAPERVWAAPAAQYLSDACRHPSGEVSGVLVGRDFKVSLVRLAPDLTPLALTQFHDPDIAGDPHPLGSMPTDLQTTGLSDDSARMACVGEDILFVVNASGFSTIAYRTSFHDGAWAAGRRTLIEPSGGVTLFLPIGGTFDTFEALSVTARSFIDVDEDENAYIATYAQSSKIRVHAAFFNDGLQSLPGDPGFPLPVHDADILLTKIDAAGARMWTRVVGGPHEDEPYAVRVRGGAVAVVGRARRVAGEDNTFWDALVTVTSTSGDPISSRTFPLDESGILLAVDGLPDGGWVVGGSDGWSQNPEGLSILSFGKKLLLELPAGDGAPVRIDLPAGPRNNEVRTVIAGGDAIWLGGEVDGPIMHTGDSDRSQIRSNGVIGVVRRPML